MPSAQIGAVRGCTYMRTAVKSGQSAVARSQQPTQAAAAAMQQIMGQQANAQAKIGNVGGLSVLPGHDISFLPHLAQRGGPNQTS